MRYLGRSCVLGEGIGESELVINGNKNYAIVCTSAPHAVGYAAFRARRLDLSFRVKGWDPLLRKLVYVDRKLDIDHPYNSLRNYTQSHKCPPCVRCPACAHTPGPSRRPCLEFSRGFIGTTSINQVRECGDIILYYIMNYEQNGK